MNAKRVVAILVLFLALAQGCAGPATAPQATAAPDHIKLYIAPFLSFMPFYIAQDEGYFAKQNLDVEFVKGVPQQQFIPALSQGQLDVYPTVITAGIFNAIAREGKIKLVANKGIFTSTPCAADGLVIRKALVDSIPAGDASKLKGRTVAYIKSSFEEYYVERLLNTAGLSTKDVTLNDLPTAVEEDALKNGTIDLTATSEPQIVRIVQDGVGSMWAPASKGVPDFDFAVVIFGPNILGKNPDAGKRFITAYLQAIQQYNQGSTPRNLEIITKESGLSKELLQKACLPTFRADGHIDTAKMQDFINWAVERKLLDAAPKPEQYYDPQFVQYAKDHLR